MFSRVKAQARRFGRADDGTLIIFALMMFVLMLMLAGLAVDLMRYEASRVALQNTLDRATLAAAALNQDLDPEAVVRDYVAKAGKASPMPRLFWSWTCPARCRARKSPG